MHTFPPPREWRMWLISSGVLSGGGGQADCGFKEEMLVTVRVPPVAGASHRPASGHNLATRTHVLRGRFMPLYLLQSEM